MNNLKSGGTLFLAYKGRMGRANVQMYSLFAILTWISLSIVKPKSQNLL